MREANFYFFVESSIALAASFFINVFVVSVFAAGLHGRTNADVNATCSSTQAVEAFADNYPNTFPNVR